MWDFVCGDVWLLMWVVVFGSVWEGVCVLMCMIGWKGESGVIWKLESGMVLNVLGFIEGMEYGCGIKWECGGLMFSVFVDKVGGGIWGKVYDGDWIVMLLWNGWVIFDGE